MMTKDSIPTMQNITGLILAAGKSTRFKGEKPKFLHTVLGKVIVDYVKDGLIPHVDEMIYVISPQLSIQDYFPNNKCVVQDQARGTGHAVMQALPHLRTDRVLIVFGDTPFVNANTLQQVCQSSTDITITAFTTKSLENPYGRVDPKTYKIIQYKDATLAQRHNPLCHGGVMLVKRTVLDDLLPKLSNHNASGEYYLPDIVNLYEGEIGMIEGTEEEFMGIDNRCDLAIAEKLKNQELITHYMLNGVTFHGPDSTYLSYDTVIGPDVEIGAHVVFGKNVIIESKVRILPFCYLENCVIRAHAVVGPFAHIREGTELGEGVQIGNFVEVKKSYIGPRSKAKHHAYLGDAVIGQGVNIGAGVITCNYDGCRKSVTTVKDQAFIGANVNLVAPITVGEKAYIAAGSTVTKDVDPTTLVIERAEEKRKKRH